MLTGVSNLDGLAALAVTGIDRPLPGPSAAHTAAQPDGFNNSGTDRELSLSVDPGTRQVVIRVLDTQTKEVLYQFPAEQLLRFAEALSKPATVTAAAGLGLSTYA
jgi:hypothetical protein